MSEILDGKKIIPYEENEKVKKQHELIKIERKKQPRRSRK